MLNFLVIGDWGRKGLFRQKETAWQMAVTADIVQTDFVISTGDNFYDAGVESVDDPNWQASFEDIYHYPSLQIPWYVVLGNHDYDGNYQAQIDYSARSSRWRLPSLYYSFSSQLQEKEVLFVFTDTSPFMFEYFLKEKSSILAQDKERQLRWLEQTLAESKAYWKIVVGHHPVYSCSPFHGNARELIQQFVPLFEKYGVDLYLAGHEHDLQLHHPAGATYYLVSGAGSEVRETGRDQHTLFSASSSGFALVQLEDQHMALEFIDDRGDILYRKVISKES